MLIRFSVENHLSIRDKQELSFVASPLRDKGADLINWRGLNLLPVALVYGANASGKSNLMSALSYFVNAVRYSHSRGTPNSSMSRVPFRLDERSVRKPSVFDIDFVLNGTRFHFGYSISDREVLEEWLFAFPAGKKQTWYMRNNKKKHIYFGKNLRGQLRTIETLVRPNSLFISAAAQNSNKQLTPIYNYLGAISWHTPEEGETEAIFSFKDGKIDARILEFLKIADTGIIDCRFEEEPKDRRSAALKADIIQLFKKHRPESKEIKPEDLDFKLISLGHATKAGRPKYLPFSLESSGTIRLLLILRSIFKGLDRGSPVVIDELDTSLHTYLTERIIAIFNSHKTNPKGAQLLATTHDTNLLSTSSIRRDEIWFAQKDSSGATSFYPLTDIRTRNTDNLEKGYLQGRFGAVPSRALIEICFPGLSNDAKASARAVPATSWAKSREQKP
jgi:AAA15 family ATPase/GTPase